MKSILLLSSIIFLTIPFSTIANQCVWTGAVNNNWSDSGNWSCNVIPDIDDTVTINNATVVLDTSVEIRRLELLGTSQLDGEKDLQITGDFIWNGSGGIGNSTGGAITILGQTTLDGSSKTILGKQLYINGGGELLNGSITLNQNSKMEFDSDQIFYVKNTNFTGITCFNNSTVINNGTLKRESENSNFFVFSQFFINNDTLLVGGRLRLSNVIMNNASVIIDEDQYLDLQTSELNNTQISGGLLYQTSGLCQVNTGTTIDSRLYVTGTLSNSISLTMNKEFRLGPHAGAVYKGNTGSLLTLNGKSSWNGPALIQGEGKIVVNDTITISGFNTTISSAQLELNHVAMWHGELMRMGLNAEIINKGIFIIESMNDAIISLTNSTPVIKNEGQFLKKDTTTLTIQTGFQNQGVIQGTGVIDFATGKLSGEGSITPGLSPGILTLDEQIDLNGELNIEINSPQGPGEGHDLLKVIGTINISDATLNLTAIDTVPEMVYTIVKCSGPANCIEGTFLTTNLAPGFSLIYTADSIQALKVPCLPTLNVPASLLANDPHQFYFFAGNLITSDGIITPAEKIIFDAGEAIELYPGFEVLSGAELQVKLDGCTPF